MNNRKFLFVTCVNDEELYSSCIRHIQKLVVPSHFTIELFPIRGAKSITSAYNKALANDAKYKIYLHQDTFILNRTFLFDILHLFQTNPTLGMLGMIGCKKLPPNGVWWEGEGVVGKVIGLMDENKTFYLMKHGEINKPFEPVEAVDGLLLATQYDLPWRDDLFHGFHFYDISQSTEFIKRGFQVGVPRQHDPWCLHYHIHHKFNHKEYMENSYIFSKNYNKNNRF